MTTLLAAKDLCVSYKARAGQTFPALAGVNFSLGHGETLGVLGESGSGKSTLAAALLRVLPANSEIYNGAVRFEGRDLLQMEPREMEKIRGARIALIFQEPSLAMHPTLRVGEQIKDVLAAHQWSNRRDREERALRVLAAVFPTETERIAKSYRHQLSGGQRGRVLIAQAISCGPSLIIADEPTASLDPEMEQEIFTLFRRLRQEFKLSLIWITHNPKLLAGFADRVMVLYAGRVVEVGATEDVLFRPRHPYTQALLKCMPPKLDEGFARHKAMLPVIQGEPPTSVFDADRCLFEPRCVERMDRCTKRAPQMVELHGSHKVSCFRYEG